MPVTIGHNTRTPWVTLNGRNHKPELLKKVLGNDRTNTHLLQGGVRMIWRATKHKGTFICLYEEAPQQRRIVFKHKYVTADTGETKFVEEEYTVWTPWIVYLIQASPVGASIVYLFFAKDSISSTNHSLYFPALPNIYAAEYTPGRVCNGALASNTLFNDGNILWQGTIAGLMSDFWTSVYNDDIMAFQDMNPFTIIQGLGELKEAEVNLPMIHHGMKNWEQLSQEQVLAIPYHHLFGLDFIINKMTEEYGLSEENANEKTYSSLYEKLLYSVENVRR